MRALCRIWSSGTDSPWYVNTGVYWQIFFALWLLATKSSMKYLGRNHADSLDRNIIISFLNGQMVLALLLTMTTIVLTKKIHRAMQQGNPSRLPEIAYPTNTPRPAATSREKPRQPQQDPVMWRRK